MKPVVVNCIFCGAANRVDLSRLSEGPKCGKCGRPIRLDRPLPVTDATFEKVRASGAEVLQEPIDQPWGPRDCAFRDPSGNMVRISQEPTA